MRLSIISESEYDDLEDADRFKTELVDVCTLCGTEIYELDEYHICRNCGCTWCGGCIKTQQIHPLPNGDLPYCDRCPG